MAGKSANLGNWSPGSPTTRYKVSGKNREFYTFENAPGLGAYATGGTIVDVGDGYIYHIFTGNETFLVNRPPAAINSVDYLIVAGGGGGGGSPLRSGGGGAGGMLSGYTIVSNTPGSYAITVGGSGGGGFPPAIPGVPYQGGFGNPSTAFGITATGGGGGGPGVTPGSLTATSGGSGGGASQTPPRAVGTGNSPATIPRQGYPGGSVPATVNTGGAGGGGAGGPGNSPPSTPIGGLGGPGRIDPNFPSTIVGRAIPAAVLPTWQPLVSPAGYAAGGGGLPAPSPRSAATNSGYGGDGAAPGGSGIVCVRYKKTAAYERATGGTIEPNTHPEHPGVWRHIFTDPGTFTVTDSTLQWIDYLAVGGGGGGGRGSNPPGYPGSGGGAGGFVTSIHTSTTTPTVIPEAYPWNPGSSVRVGKQMPVSAGAYPIGIGTGGNGGTSAPTSGSTGSNTTIGAPGPSQIIAAGGGGGAYFGTGGSGGSGGGASQTIALSAGSATPSPLIQGNFGGPTNPQPAYQAGGGGGAGSAGGDASPSGNCVGGAGWYSVLSPSAYGTPGPLTPTSQYRYFAGGGGGSRAPFAPFGYPAIFNASGGVGGGGASSPSGPGTPGTTNTGGGGGGGVAPGNGGNGGPGIVIIQYPE